jgi:hypothetical protein
MVDSKKISDKCSKKEPEMKADLCHSATKKQRAIHIYFMKTSASHLGLDDDSPVTKKSRMAIKNCND